MKKILGSVFTAIFLLNINNVYALSCIEPEESRQRAEYIHLFEIVSIEDDFTKDCRETDSDCSLNKKAQIETLKVYRGDVNQLSNVKEVTTKIGCDSGIFPDYMPSCSAYNNKNYPFQAGDRIIRFGNGSIDTVYYGLCIFWGLETGTLINIRTKDALEMFELDYKPIWKKRDYKELPPSLLPAPVPILD